MSRPDPKRIQTRFKESIALWIERALQPGHFLMAVLSNDLRGAIERGDDAALDNLPHIISYLYNKAPAGCWGSPEKVSKWTGLGPDAMAGWREAHP